MAFDAKLADRVRGVLRRRRGVQEKKMFGGLVFLVNGNLSCGVEGEKLLVRVGRDAFEEALQRRHATPMDFTGKPSRGIVYVAKPGVRTKAQLRKWVDQGAAFARSLPAK